jgi:hypothetical protein
LLRFRAQGSGFRGSRLRVQGSRLKMQKPNPDKPEIAIYKHQNTNKFQIPIFNDRNRFGI